MTKQHKILQAYNEVRNIFVFFTSTHKVNLVPHFPVLHIQSTRGRLVHEALIVVVVVILRFITRTVSRRTRIVGAGSRQVWQVDRDGCAT